MRNLLLFILSLSFVPISAQQLIKGKIIDADTRKPLPFVSILFDGSNQGVSSDIDGNYQLPIVKEDQIIVFSYIGYEKKKLTVDELKEKEGIVALQTSDYEIGEVVILPGENPAHRIIKLAVKNSDINNPEKATDFSYESYNKIVFTTPLDSAGESRLDTITQLSLLDSSVENYDKNKILFLMESISEKNYFPPDNSSEIVTASRISGLQKPFFSLLGTQFQSFSLYDEYINIYGQNYLSPITKSSINKYLFILEDTLYSGNDTSFIISFRPRRNRYFTALQGVLSINTNRYAVENLVAKQHDSTKFPVRIQQKYENVQGKQWFPVQLHIDILFKMLNATNGEDFMMTGKSYLRNVQLSSKIPKKQMSNVILKMSDDIKQENDQFWKENREVPLTSKEAASYQYIDSVGKAENLDQFIVLNQGFLNGYIPAGPVNILLNHIVRFNDYEGFRLGLGLETNEKLLKSVRLGGYGAYGFKDKKLKYGSHIRWIPKSEREFELKASYMNDVVESGGVQFLNYTSDLINNQSIQNILIPQMDGVEKYQVELSLRALRDFKFSFFGNQQERKINSSYTFSEDGNSSATEAFNLTEAGINVRFAFKEKFANFMGINIPITAKYPLVYFKYTRGFNSVLEGDFEYNRFDLSIFKNAVIKNLGTASIQLLGGVVDGSVPITTAYRMRGILDDDLKVASAFSFETMTPNEFFADRYINVFFRHNFGSLIYQRSKFKPELLLVSSMAFGSLSNKEAHQNFAFLVPNKGFFESGIQLNNLIRWEYFYKGIFIGFGAGTYYRYGAYHLEEWEDNIAVKLTTTLSM